MKSITNALPKSSGGGTILPEEIIEIKEFKKKSTDANGYLELQFDGIDKTSENFVYAIALIELGGTENNLISDRVEISLTPNDFVLYSSNGESSFVNATSRINDGRVAILIADLIRNTIYNYVGFLVKTNN